MAQLFTVVAAPGRLYRRGAQFEKQAIAHTLWLACWPDGMVVRDANNRWFEVERYQTREAEHQRLVSLGGNVALVPTGNNGGLREVEVR